MHILNKTGLFAGNIVSSTPVIGVKSGIMSDNFENLSREELIERLSAKERENTVHPNSAMALLTMDGRETHNHIVDVMNPMQKGVIAFVAFIFLVVAPAIFFIGTS